ncbi:NADP oxidoreductase coenzyme F420-dependent [Kitasatospora acidiphila]|uniref:NADP oxidoreductase coenzyme F420-dependent n=1 Tax=Kitasatospora acidiphila TaxID=2567942 RepID=A0A540VXY6_9ACTN|nr:NAD(P)-binding domain-containing protein [Kitasatospora acidiphila]TQF01621.1 NADP oxidoreductase coenzyme F420-dependent [Kitasatospora acidiphila]
MTTAIVGVGSIGSTLARHLVAGGENVVLAGKGASRANELAAELGPLAQAAPSVPDAIASADTVVLAIWLDHMRELVPQVAPLLDGKVVIDPSNPIAFDDKGQIVRSLPEGQSAGSVAAALLPEGAHYVKAFGTLAAEALAASANRTPHRAVLFYATDDDSAARAAERLIRTAGFEPVKAGGLAAAGRIEAPGGDLHQFGFNGEVVDLDRARAAV